VDAAVVPRLRCQRRASSATRARPQSWQLLAHAGDARADQGLVADQPEGEADQDRRQGRPSRALSRLPDGRGRRAENPVSRDRAAYRRAATTTGHRVSMNTSVVTRPSKNQGRGAP
jgi:hypothetical protein